MPTFLRPVAGPVTATFADHRDRVPPSTDPGTDYGVRIGTPVAAIAAGVVIGIKRSTSAPAGRYIEVRHTVDGVRFVSRYLHLSRIDVGLGQAIQQGQIIGASGASGNVLAHLHLALIRDGVHVDAQLYLSTTTAPAGDTAPIPIRPTRGVSMFILIEQPDDGTVWFVSLITGNRVKVYYPHISALTRLRDATLAPGAPFDFYFGDYQTYTRYLDQADEPDRVA